MEKPQDGQRIKEDDQRRAELEQRVRYRVSCEAKAFDVVNRLLEMSITEDYLKEACQLITRSQYEDVVEERAIVHQCGYPLCDNTLTNVPKKKYHISTKSNRVFDITERKNFCSNQCYKASKHLQKQVPDTVVWGRENEPRVTFSLLAAAENSGDIGEEVVGADNYSLKQDVGVLEGRDASKQKTRTAVPKHEASEDPKKQHLQKTRTAVPKHEVSEDPKKQHLQKTRTAVPKHEASEDPKKQHLQKTRTAVPKHEASEDPKKQNLQTDFQHASKEEALTERMKRLTVGQNREETEWTIRRKDTEYLCYVPAAEVLPESGDSSLKCSLKSLAVGDKIPPPDIHTDDEEDANLENTAPCIVTACPNPSEIPVCQTGMVVKEKNNASGQTHHMELLESPHPHASDKAVVKESSSESLSQFPGEPKAAYLMRLLDRQKNRLSTMADIKSAINVQSKGDDTLPPSSTEQMHSATLRSHNQVDHAACQATIKPVTKNRPLPKLSQPHHSPLEAVGHIIQQWITQETLTYLRCSSLGDRSQDDTPSTFHTDPEMQRKYQNLCQRLAGQEKDFEDVLGEENVENADEEKRRNPLPHFEDLKKQNTELQLRVSDFLKGPVPSKKKVVKQGEAGETTDVEHARPIILPAVDSHNQQLIRRRIVLDRLNHAITALLPPLGLSMQDVSDVLRELVFTFSFTSQNIVFKPAEWSLVSFILLQMMTYRSTVVALVLNSERKCKTLDVVLGRLGHSSASLSQMVDDMLSEQAVTE